MRMSVATAPHQFEGRPISKPTIPAAAMIARFVSMGSTRNMEAIVSAIPSPMVPVNQHATASDPDFQRADLNPRPLHYCINLAVVDEIAAPDMLLQYSLHEPRRGREDIKAFMTDFRAAFPDLNFWGTADLIAEGDYVVGPWEGGGTHTGPAFKDFLVGALPAATGRSALHRHDRIETNATSPVRSCRCRWVCRRHSSSAA